MIKLKTIYEELTAKDFEPVLKQADERAMSSIIQGVMRGKPFEKVCKEYKKKYRKGMDEKRWKEKIADVAKKELLNRNKLTKREIERGLNS